MNQSRGIILHIEDEPGMVELVREALAADGWELRAATTGSRGLELVARESIQLLLLDYALPDMLGTQFLERAHRLVRKLPPFIVTTGVGSETIAVEMMKRGAADYLIKDSRFLGQIAPVVRRVAHEAELAQRLEKTELQLGFLVQHLPDVLTIISADGHPRYQSPAAQTITGYRAEELPVDLQPLIHPEDLTLVQAWWREVTASPEATARATFRVLRKDGSIVWLEAVAQNQLDNPALQGVIINARDITGRKLAEQERLQMQSQLLHSQKLESLGVLAGGIAHDFNNLLAVILGNLDLAVTFLPEPSDAQEPVVAALKAAQHASHLTRQMLAYSGRGAFAMESVNISTLIRENLQIFSISVSRNIELVTNIADDLAPVLGSPGQLQQVVMNLLTNASEAIGDVPGRITLSTEQGYLSQAELAQSLVREGARPGEHACLSVADTGCGISPAVLERLFDPFFTTKRTGRGLGMAAVLGIVRGHGGALFVDSLEGKGTTIRVCFPTQPNPSPTVATMKSSTGGRQFGKRILVVDDEQAVRAMTVRLLRRLGCTTIEASDGREALAVVAEDPQIDAILMDLTMPNLGGAEAASQLRKQGHCPPIILYSGYGESVMANGNPIEGATAFLQKPFRLTELERTLERLFCNPDPVL